MCRESVLTYTEEWERFSADGSVIFGRDDNFDEWSAADVVIADAVVEGNTEVIAARRRRCHVVQRLRSRSRRSRSRRRRRRNSPTVIQPTVGHPG